MTRTDLDWHARAQAAEARVAELAAERARLWEENNRLRAERRGGEDYERPGGGTRAAGGRVLRAAGGRHADVGVVADHGPAARRQGVQRQGPPQARPLMAPVVT